MISITSVPNFPNPIQSIRHNQAMKTLWRRKEGALDFNYLAPLLSSWASVPRSSILIVKGTLTTRRYTKSLVMDIFDLVKSANIPIVWALKGNSEVQPENDMTIQTLKYLVMQVLQLNRAILNEISGSFSAAVLQSATTEEDWFNILHIVTSGLSELYMIIDAELLQLSTKENYWSSDFLRMLQKFIHQTNHTVIKVVIFSSRQFRDQTKFSTEDVVFAEIKKPQIIGKWQMPASSRWGGSKIATRGGRGSSVYLANSIAMRQRV
jgi:hypothetical protein